MKLDVRGYKCPIPVLRLEKLISKCEPGDQIILLATDPLAPLDITAFCQQNQHDVVLLEKADITEHDEDFETENEEGPVLHFQIHVGPSSLL